MNGGPVLKSPVFGVSEGQVGLWFLLKEQDVWTLHKKQQHWYFIFTVPVPTLTAN